MLKGAWGPGGVTQTWNPDLLLSPPPGPPLRLPGPSTDRAGVQELVQLRPLTWGLSATEPGSASRGGLTSGAPSLPVSTPTSEPPHLPASPYRAGGEGFAVPSEGAVSRTLSRGGTGAQRGAKHELRFCPREGVERKGHLAPCFRKGGMGAELAEGGRQAGGLGRIRHQSPPGVCWGAGTPRSWGHGELKTTS